MLPNEDDDDDDNGPEKTYKLSCGHLYPHFTLSTALQKYSVLRRRFLKKKKNSLNSAICFFYLFFEVCILSHQVLACTTFKS